MDESAVQALEHSHRHYDTRTYSQTHGEWNCAACRWLAHCRPARGQCIARAHGSLRSLCPRAWRRPPAHHRGSRHDVSINQRDGAVRQRARAGGRGRSHSCQLRLRISSPWLSVRCSRPRAPIVTCTRIVRVTTRAAVAVGRARRTVLLIAFVCVSHVFLPTLVPAGRLRRRRASTASPHSRYGARVPLPLRLRAFPSRPFARSRSKQLARVALRLSHCARAHSPGMHVLPFAYVKSHHSRLRASAPTAFD